MNKTRLPRKKLFKLIDGLYFRGYCDGQDSTRGNQDRFYGNQQAWEQWRRDLYKKTYEELQGLIRPKKESTQ